MIEFIVDATGRGTPFPHFWEHCVGSCHAIMGLRANWREQLETSHRELGFQYVRFHGLLNDEMSVLVKDVNPFVKDAPATLRYSFFHIDSIFDFLLSIGMKPFIELGFMPEALASGTQTCFHYRGNVTPPADYEAWAALVKALTRHLVQRYGLEEVRTWFFEVWNEPNLKYFWAGTQEEYFKLYEYAARAVKSVDRQLRVGGPATSINAWIPEMLDFCRNADVPIDFISTHHYPTDDPLWRNDGLSLEEFFEQFGDELGKYERGVLQKMTLRARQEAGALPLYYTEWNTSAMLPDPIHDEAYSAALIAKTIVDNDGLVDGYSFWTFSDLFEERAQFAAPFHGGFGLQTIHGIPKPAYRVFKMLHELGTERVAVTCGSESTVEMLATRRGSELKLLIYNHNIPEAEIHEESVEIILRGLVPAGPVSISRVDSMHANPKRKWIELGSPEYPTRSELAQIEEAAAVTATRLSFETNRTGSILRFAIAPHAVTAITVPI